MEFNREFKKQLKVYIYKRRHSIWCERFQFIASYKIWSIECNKKKIEFNRTLEKQLKLEIKTCSHVFNLLLVVKWNLKHFLNKLH